MDVHADVCGRAVDTIYAMQMVEETFLGLKVSERRSQCDTNSSAFSLSLSNNNTIYLDIFFYLIPLTMKEIPSIHTIDDRTSKVENFVKFLTRGISLSFFVRAEN